MLGFNCIVTRIHKKEAACSISVFNLTRLKAVLSK